MLTLLHSFIPGIVGQIVHLRLSPIEQAFYDRTRRQCCTDVAAVQRRWNRSGAALDARLTRDELRSVVRPLLRLRQACCHPRVRYLKPPSPFPADTHDDCSPHALCHNRLGAWGAPQVLHRVAAVQAAGATVVAPVLAVVELEVDLCR